VSILDGAMINSGKLSIKRPKYNFNISGKFRLTMSVNGMMPLQIIAANSMTTLSSWTEFL